MRWLTERPGDEQGAVAVIVALTLVVMVGMGALVVDVGNLYFERRQLQNGADAGALAAAQDFASGQDASAEPSAREYASHNNTRGAFVSEFVPDLGANEVTVTARTGSSGGEGTLAAFLAQVIGHSDYFATATATAHWGGIGGGDTIPLTISWCDWDAMTGGAGAEALPTTATTIFHEDSQNSEPPECSGPSGLNMPGGFGWLDETGTCEATVELGIVGSDPGNSMSQDCKDVFASLIGQTVLIPIHGVASGSGQHATYEIIGFAALELTGYRFPSVSDGDPCGAPATCISGSFEEFYDLGEQPDPTAPDFGAYTIGLVG